VLHTAKTEGGPKTDPCGTPNKSIISIERLQLNKTRWDLSVRNDQIRVRVIPPKPKLDCSHLLLLGNNAATNFNRLKTLVRGWWYAYAVQRIATSPFNKVLTTNGAGKQQGAD